MNCLNLEKSKKKLPNGMKNRRKNQKYRTLTSKLLRPKQKSSFYIFNNYSYRQQEELKQQRSVEDNKLGELLDLKTKNDYDNLMRDKVAQMRDLEAILRGKDHEIDTLELIQSQKDQIILELEEKAGKVKEIIKEITYESQKNDKLDQSLEKYITLKPTKIPLKKLGDGYYKFGTRRIFIKLDNDQETMLVRIGPKEYITLAMFLIENEGIELQKMSTNNRERDRSQNAGSLTRK